MNWFHKLMLVLLAFVSMMVYFAVRSVQTPLDLVTEKYYEAELKYQDRIDQISNDQQLTEKVKISVVDRMLHIEFPSTVKGQEVKGVVKMYYPADQRKDREIPLNLQGSNAQQIDVSALQGAYSIQVDWTYLDKSFYTEQKMFF